MRKSLFQQAAHKLVYVFDIRLIRIQPIQRRANLAAFDQLKHICQNGRVISQACKSQPGVINSLNSLSINLSTLPATCACELSVATLRTCSSRSVKKV